jgi:hypothetical protein
MLRGRLDGAERLITAILPDSDEATLWVREHLIKEAQEAIAEEWEKFEAQFASPARPGAAKAPGAREVEQ